MQMYHIKSQTAPHLRRLVVRILKAKFHYTGQTGPDRTRTDFVGDSHGPTEFLGDSGRSGPVGSGLARVVEFGL